MDDSCEPKPAFASQLADLRQVPLSRVSTLDDPELAQALQRIVPGSEDSPGAPRVPVAAFNSYI